MKEIGGKNELSRLKLAIKLDKYAGFFKKEIVLLYRKSNIISLVYLLTKFKIIRFPKAMARMVIPPIT